MAVTKFHITPDGPKRCKATFRPCPFSDHYLSAESAMAADIVNRKNAIHLAELKRLEESHRNPDPKYFSRTSFTFGKGTTSPRKFGEEIDHRTSNLGVKPEIYHSMGQFRMKNGNGMEVNVQVMRMTEIDEGYAKFVGVWRFVRKANKIGLQRHTETIQDIVLDFSTDKLAKRSMLQAREFFRTAAISSGIYDEDKADLTADEMAEDFKNMFNAIESDASGEYDLYDRGMGYFTESNNDTIVADVNYRTSAFRVENFKNFLAEHPVYSNHTPNAEIRVTDKHPFTGASWTIKKEAGQWAVEKLYADGTGETIPVFNSQEALDHVYYHNIAEVNPDDKDESLAKSLYAARLMDGVEKALEDHSISVIEYREQSKARQQALSDGKITKDMYDLGIEPQDTLMGKIFQTFT